jgi:hypothetical protein
MHNHCADFSGSVSLQALLDLALCFSHAFHFGYRCGNYSVSDRAVLALTFDRPMKDQLETVYTVTNFYDGPRGGIADYHGKPHVYCSCWDEAKEDWDEAFLLQPIDDETFRMALEDWGIWTRWERAFHSGQTTRETHPALPDERARHEELAGILNARLQIEPARAIRVRGEFRVRRQGEFGGKGGAQWAVSWLSGAVTFPA